MAKGANGSSAINAAPPPTKMTQARIGVRLWMILSIVL